MALVEVKPVETVKWHGKQGIESFTQPTTIEVLYDSKTGRYATGLTPEEAKEFGEKLGQSLDDIFDAAKPHPYWSTAAARIKLPNHTVVFDTSKPQDFVKVANLKASKYVANSYQDYVSGKYPEATHIIFSEEEEIAVKATKVEKKNLCVKLALEMNREQKINIIEILGEKSARGKTDNFITVELEKIIENKPEDFIRYAQMDPAKVYVRAAVLEAIHRNILTKEGTAVYYLGDKLASDVEGAIEYFENPQNQQLKLSILEKLNK